MSLFLLTFYRDGGPWLQHGDRVRIEAFDERGNSPFGAIDRLVVA